jgi:hypothetical protein
VQAIATGTAWLCPPAKLAQLSELVSTKNSQQEIENWTRQWNVGAAVILPMWFPEDKPTFSILQYTGLIEEQLAIKVAEFPNGTELLWQFQEQGLASMQKQQAVYELLRTVAEQHGVKIQKR